MLEQFVRFAKLIHKSLYKLLVIAAFKLYLLLREKFRTCPQFRQSRMETVPLLTIEKPQRKNGCRRRDRRRKENFPVVSFFPSKVIPGQDAQITQSCVGGKRQNNLKSNLSWDMF